MLAGIRLCPSMRTYFLRLSTQRFGNVHPPDTGPPANTDSAQCSAQYHDGAQLDPAYGRDHAPACLLGPSHIAWLKHLTMIAASRTQERRDSLSTGIPAWFWRCCLCSCTPLACEPQTWMVDRACRCEDRPSRCPANQGDRRAICRPLSRSGLSLVQTQVPSAFRHWRLHLAYHRRK
ncbi:hypothetical protein BC834DRAFT_627176 [Gloeopeniophorella convolvens]|nr:hypothetical protein BC834DRAFT_627176 [Gloeopeniophorella convolvens]